MIFASIVGVVMGRWLLYDYYGICYTFHCIIIFTPLKLSLAGNVENCNFPGDVYESYF